MAKQGNEMKDMTTKEIKHALIIRLRDAGFEDYISIIEMFENKVYADAYEQFERDQENKSNKG